MTEVTVDPYALYRYFDVRDILLYVGMTGDLAKRDKTHISKSAFMQLAARSAIERRKTLGDVKEAEQKAIETERPIFNIQYNDTPEARERLRAYLEEIGRLDLLTPKIRAAIEEDQRARERVRGAERAPEPAGDAPEDEEYWAGWEQRKARWDAEAEGAWWRPWLYSGSNWHDPDELMPLLCPIYTAAEAEAQWHWWRKPENADYAWPLIYASVVQSWDESDESGLFGFREHWSAHSDHTSCVTIPFREFTREAAAVQDELAEALIAAGRCTAEKGQARVDLCGFASKNEARAAGAILNELAWGRTRVAKECIALLRQFGPTGKRPASTAQPVDGWKGGDGFPIPI